MRRISAIREDNLVAVPAPFPRSLLTTSVAKIFTPGACAGDRLLPRWIFLRALALIYFSAFYSLLFQIRGLIGPAGILPASRYLPLVSRSAPGIARFWYVPSLFWISAGSPMLMAVSWIGLLASLLLLFNLWPRFALLVCFVCFLSFVAAAGDFSGYQSDGMLLEAGFISLFFAPPGLRPGLGSGHPPSRFSLFLLQWEWLRIYFESGVVKLASGDPQWRNLTAMDQYYQNGPLPTWIGWYLQHLPHWFQAGTVVATLLMELFLIWLILLPRRFRILLFFIVTCWELGVILTANYAFLNYLVLCLGILLVDDRFLKRALPQLKRWQPAAVPRISRSRLQSVRGALATVMLAWIFYVTTAELLWILLPSIPLPRLPVTLLDPFRIANQYGLFAVMTRGRYEIEFQGSRDGHTWIPYPFRYKPQALNEPPRIFAPYQPRFDWNLWFESLGVWSDNSIVPNTEVRLLSNDPDVLSLFAGNPFAAAAPKQIRAVLWQYWFTTLPQKRATGNWWRRELLGAYAPTIELRPDGTAVVVAMPDLTAAHP